MTLVIETHAPLSGNCTLILASEVNLLWALRSVHIEVFEGFGRLLRKDLEKAGNEVGTCMHGVFTNFSTLDTYVLFINSSLLTRVSDSIFCYLSST